MKFNLLGFSQDKVMQYNNAHPKNRLDAVDLFILNWFINFSCSKNKKGGCAMQIFKKNTPDGDKTFYRVKYNGLLTEFPIFNATSTKAISNRFTKYVTGGLMAREVFRGKASKNRGGAAVAFCLTNEFNLLYDKDEYTKQKDNIKNTSNTTNINNSLLSKPTLPQHKESNISNNNNNSNNKNYNKETLGSNKTTRQNALDKKIDGNQTYCQSTLDGNKSSCQKALDGNQTSRPYNDPSTIDNTYTKKDTHTNECANECVRSLFQEWSKIGIAENESEFIESYKRLRNWNKLKLSDKQIKDAIHNYALVCNSPNSWWSSRQSFSNFCNYNTIYRFCNGTFQESKYLKKQNWYQNTSNNYKKQQVQSNKNNGYDNNCNNYSNNTNTDIEQYEPKYSTIGKHYNTVEEGLRLIGWSEEKIKEYATDIQEAKKYYQDESYAA